MSLSAGDDGGQLVYMTGGREGRVILLFKVKVLRDFYYGACRESKGVSRCCLRG